MRLSKSTPGGLRYTFDRLTIVCRTPLESVMRLPRVLPAFLVLAFDEGLAGLALGVQGIEPLLEAFLGGFAGVDGAAD